MSTTRPDFATSTFWINTGERVVRTAAQAALAVGVTNATTALHADWQQAGLTVAVAAGTCLLMCLAGKVQGDPDSPSFVLPAPREQQQQQQQGRHELEPGELERRTLGVAPPPPYDRDARTHRDRGQSQRGSEW